MPFCCNHLISLIKSITCQPLNKSHFFQGLAVRLARYYFSLQTKWEDCVMRNCHWIFLWLAFCLVVAHGCAPHVEDCPKGYQRNEKGVCVKHQYRCSTTKCGADVDRRECLENLCTDWDTLTECLSDQICLNEDAKAVCMLFRRALFHPSREIVSDMKQIHPQREVSLDLSCYRIKR